MSTAPEVPDNPMGTDGFEFVEYTAPDPHLLGALFEQLGFAPVARHRSKDVILYRQGAINFIVNREADSFAQSFARVHGPSACAFANRAKAAAEQTPPIDFNTSRRLNFIRRTSFVVGSSVFGLPGIMLFFYSEAAESALRSRCSASAVQ